MSVKQISARSFPGALAALLVLGASPALAQGTDAAPQATPPEPKKSSTAAKTEDRTKRHLAVLALAKRLSAGEAEAITGLLTALDDEVAQIRLDAAVALGRGGRAAVPGLLGVLTGGSPRARSNAALALGRLGSDAGASVSVLAYSLKDKDPEVRGQAAVALWKIRTTSADAVGALIVMLKTDDPFRRAKAAVALAVTAPDPKAIFTALEDALDDEEEVVRIHASWAFYELGEKAASRTPILLKKFHSMTGMDRRMLSFALLNLGPKAEAEIERAAKTDPQLRQLLSYMKYSRRTRRPGGNHKRESE